ncbi:MAG TPA: prepilin-type N-terminal cleavage/methylation domain-containing protein [Opitutales bacterium]|nr:prepilin-type N-terminal cleavage/methylation domain-containing protein [Opitutales bacterium]
MEREIHNQSRFAANPEGGFTLVEIMVSSALSMMLLAGILAAFFHLTKTGIAMGNYHDLERDSRMALQFFARDVHQADEAHWPNSQTLRLSVDGDDILYLYDSNARTFVRRAAGQPDMVLASGIRNLNFRSFDISQNELPLTSNPSNAGPLTKMIQVSIELERRAGMSSNRASVISSRYMMRNKKVQ